MRKLIWLPAIAAALWSGYWYAGARSIEAGLRAWLEARRAEGWQAEVAEIGTDGFPLRFDTALEDVALVDPATGLGWDASSFRFVAPAYAPTKVTATWPENQQILTPQERIDISAARMQAALALVPGPNLTLDTAEATLADVVLTSSADWTAALDSGSLSTTRTEADPLAHDIRFTARKLVPARFLLAELDPTGKLPRVVDALDLDVRAGFDAPWDRHAIEDRRPQPTSLEIRKLRAEWGEMLLEAAGDLTVDADGIPAGSITVRAVNWREMLEVASAGGWLPEDFLPTVERGLEVLAGLSGNPETIDAPLTLRDGYITLGIVPIGPAPDLTIR
jgi:hypothetical protein